MPLVSGLGALRMAGEMRAMASAGKGIVVLKERNEMVSMQQANELDKRKVSLELLLDSPGFDRSPYAS